MKNYLGSIQFSFLFLLGILTSCQENEILYEYYPDGSIQEKIISISEVNNEFIRMKYYESGQLYDSQYFFKNKLMGLRKMMELNDTVYYLFEYKEGNKTGYTEIYNLQDKLLANGMSDENEKNIGEWLYYFDDGNLFAYKYYNKYGDLVYFQFMNNDGTIKTFKGHPIASIITPSDTINVNEEYQAEFELIQPPIVKINIKLGNLISEDSIYYYETCFAAKKHIGFADRFKVPGEYIKIFNWEIVNPESDERITGQDRHKIIVK